MNAFAEIRVAKASIEHVLDALQHFLGDDEQLKLDMLEGETNLNGVVSDLLASIEDDEGLVNALDVQIDARAARQERAKHRIDAKRRAIASLMDCALLTKLALPEATLSLRTIAPKAKVVNADELPDEFVRTIETRKPDTDAIKAAVEAGQSIPGVVMTNGDASLTIRRK